MPSRPPSKPGWYKDPDNPRLLRHWDGSAWGDSSRTAPAWYRSTELFLADERADRSAEGPVHPHELRERVASIGAWSRDWLPWRPRPLEPSGPRLGTGYVGSRPGSARPVPPAGMGPAGRPLLAMVCLLVVAVAVVISSVAFITPYEVRRDLPAAQSALSHRLARLADRQCISALPGERAAFATQARPPSLLASALQVAQLRTGLSRYASDGGRFEEWLSALGHLVQDQRHYAAALQAPALGASSLGGSSLQAAAGQSPAGVKAPRAVNQLVRTVDASAWREQVLTDAANADQFSAGLALGDACTLGLVAGT
jgi:hypothetical protein